jgi:hypothetical protein
LAHSVTHHGHLLLGRLLLALLGECRPRTETNSADQRHGEETRMLFHDLIFLWVSQLVQNNRHDKRLQPFGRLCFDGGQASIMGLSVKRRVLAAKTKQFAEYEMSCAIRLRRCGADSVRWSCQPNLPCRHAFVVGAGLQPHATPDWRCSKQRARARCGSDGKADHRRASLP